MKRKISIFVFILLSVSIFGQNYVKRLDSKYDYDIFSGPPLVDKYSEVSAVKVVYVLKSKEIFYINSRYFTYHHQFCSNELEPDVELEFFNKINYTNDPRRKYLLATIIYFKSLDIYALEITPVDLMTKEDIILLSNIVSKSTFISDSLHLLLNSTRLQKYRSSFEGKIPLLNPSDIYRNLNYQAISKYKGCGVLHFINDLKSENDDIKPNDIIVINETPLGLPKVAGVIVNEFQTPLSHLIILGQNRKIPISAYKLAFEDSSLLKLNNEKVCLDVLSDTFNIDLVDKFPIPKSNQNPIRLKFDLKVDSLVGVENLDKKAFKYAGYKASNFGVLYQLSKKCDFKVPECAFVIPFYFYNQHIQSSIVKQLIDNLLVLKNEIHNIDSLKYMLKNIRDAILSSPLDSGLLHSIYNRALANSDCVRMRFRSSTNAEDAKGFSGAGLYTSKTGILYDEKNSFEVAIKKVWASLWSFEAYSEREYFTIDHRIVYMGILVHRSFPNEEVNGVAITKNLYRPDNYGFVVNAQLGDESVVKPKEGIVSDQFICYPNSADDIYKNKNTVDIITQSSLNGNNLVMNETEIQNLANQLDLIKKYFFRHTFTSKSYLDFGLDVEFKLESKNRILYLKQVRLYND